MSLRASPLITTAALARSAIAFGFALVSVSALGAETFGHYSAIWAFAVATIACLSIFNTALIARLVELRDAARGEAQGLAKGVGAFIAGAALLLLLGSLLVWRADANRSPLPRGTRFAGSLVRVQVAWR